MYVWLSDILDRPVWDAQNNRLGVCRDELVADVDIEFPPLRAIAVGEKTGAPRLYAAGDIAWLRPSIILSSATPTLYEPRGDELWLRRQVLDRQIVDTEGRRLVRANDLQFARRNSHYCLAGVDVGSQGLARRLGIEGAVTGAMRLLRREMPEPMIPWSDVAPLEAGGAPGAPIRLRVSRDKLGQLHPADIAAIVSELDRTTGQALLTALDTPTVADAIQEIEPELQVTVLENLPPERAVDVLEEMDPNDAADLLADLEPVDREKYLDLMEDEEATHIEKLLAYPPDSAGGIMTTEFTTIYRGLTVGQALESLRQSPAAREDETMFYIYIVDEESKLLGAISLRSLVMAAPETPVEKLVDEHPVTVDLLTPQHEVAHIVAKYNLLAVPVVDEQGVLHGIVTVDDAIDAIIPTAWKKRLPRFY